MQSWGKKLGVWSSELGDCSLELGDSSSELWNWSSDLTFEVPAAFETVEISCQTLKPRSDDPYTRKETENHFRKKPSRLQGRPAPNQQNPKKETSEQTSQRNPGQTNRGKQMNPRLFMFLIGMLLAVDCSKTQPQVKALKSEKTKNVIIIIGDGMGPQQVGLLLTYARQAPHSGQRQNDRA